MKRKLLLVCLVICSVFSIPVLASDMPHTVTTNITEDEVITTIFNDAVYSIQESVMPFSLWSLLYIIGIALLLISIILHEHGGIVTGLMSLAFISVVMLNSVFLGFTDVVSYATETSTIIQPVVSVYGSHSLNLLVFLTFLVAILNIFLLIMNMLAKSPLIKPDYHGGLK